MAKLPKQYKALRISDDVFNDIRRMKNCYEIVGILGHSVKFDTLIQHLIGLVQLGDPAVWKLFRMPTNVTSTKQAKTKEETAKKTNRKILTESTEEKRVPVQNSDSTITENEDSDIDKNIQTIHVEDSNHYQQYDDITQSNPLPFPPMEIDL